MAASLFRNMNPQQPHTLGQRHQVMEAGPRGGEPFPVSGDFVHRSARTKVILRPNALRQLATELKELEIRRPVLLSGRRTSCSPVYSEVRASLTNFDLVAFDEVPEHSSVATVEAVVRCAIAHEADGFVVVGGGSASDTAKAAAIWLGEGGSLEAHASRFTPPKTLVIPELKQPKLPIVAVPCTASGAEVTPSLGIRTKDGRKLLFWDLNVASRVILIDPVANAASVPSTIMLSTGMNGLAHCIEGLYSQVRTPITRALALHAVSLFARALPGVAREPNTASRRSELLAAAHLSGLVLMNARTCLHHAICHALGAASGVSHGAVNAVILPHAMAFNAPAAEGAFRDIARAWDGTGGEPNGGCAIACVRNLQAEIGVPTRLRDIGVERASLRGVARKMMTERGLYFNPRQVRGPREIEALLEAAW